MKTLLYRLQPPELDIDRNKGSRAHATPARRSILPTIQPLAHLARAAHFSYTGNHERTRRSGGVECRPTSPARS